MVPDSSMTRFPSGKTHVKKALANPPKAGPEREAELEPSGARSKKWMVEGLLPGPR